MKKIIISIILISITILLILLFNNKKYNKYIIDSNKWNNIINNKTLSNDIYINNIKFNDYPLIIDNENSIIYYYNKLNNPNIEYNVFNLKLVINDNNIMIYNQKYYRIYKLVYIDYPIININLKEGDALEEITIIDNNKIIHSLCKVKIKDDKYIIKFKQESLGNNIRENYLNILGNNLDEIILKKGSGNIRLFINNKDLGIYIMEGDKFEK